MSSKLTGLKGRPKALFETIDVAIYVAIRIEDGDGEALLYT